MFNSKNITSHSVVLADKRITRLPTNSAISLNIDNIPVPFDELTNTILITNSLRQNNIQEIVQPILGANQFSKQFETINFSFKLDILRFVILQKANFNNFQCASLMQTLIGYDTTYNTIGYLGSIGVNYEHQLTIANNINGSNTLFNKILSANSISVNNKQLTGGNFKFAYNINQHLLINIEIFTRSEQWFMSFNADSLITAENTIETILKTDFYNDFYLPMAIALLTETNN